MVKQEKNVERKVLVVEKKENVEMEEVEVQKVEKEVVV